MSTGNRISGLTVVVFFSLGYPLIVTSNYGFSIRDRIDTGGSLAALKADFSLIWRNYEIFGRAMMWIVDKLFR